MIKFFAGVTLAVVLLSTGIGVGYASRNSTGTMSAINGPYVSGTTISSSAINARFSDVETELSDSLSRSGKGGMTAPLRTADGSVAAPAWSFTSDTGSGWWRIGSSDFGFSVNGTKKLELTSALFTVTPAASFSSTLAVTGATTLTGGLAEPVSGDKVLQAGTTFPVLLLAGPSGTPSIGFNTYWDGVNNKYVATNYAAKQTLDGSGNWIFYTAPSGTAGNNLTLTERFRITSSGVTIGVSGTVASQVNYGICTLNGGTPANCTATVASGARCVASINANLAASVHPIGVSVAATTLTVTSNTNGDTAIVHYICFG